MNPLSASSVKLLLRVNDLHLASCSGFIYERRGRNYLVTSLHNITGRDFFTTKCLSDKLAIPNRADCIGWKVRPSGRLVKIAVQLELFKNDIPNFYFDWSENGADIACFDLQDSSFPSRLAPIASEPPKQFLVGVGEDLNVIGFPGNIESEAPIWKRAMIASEPDFSINGRNHLLLDGKTFSGMSGSACVVWKSQGQAVGINGLRSHVIDTQHTANLIGVYGGRYSTDVREDPNIAFCWRKVHLDTILDRQSQIGDIDQP